MMVCTLAAWLYMRVHASSLALHGVHASSLARRRDGYRQFGVVSWPPGFMGPSRSYLFRRAVICAIMPCDHVPFPAIRTRRVAMFPILLDGPIH